MGEPKRRDGCDHPAGRSGDGVRAGGLSVEAAAVGRAEGRRVQSRRKARGGGLGDGRTAAGLRPVGYLPFEAHAAHLFFQLVSRRYERGSMLITSNRSVGERGEVFGDAVVATAILDRLLHHSHVLTITGESYRLREKRRAGVLNAPTAPAAQAAS